MPTYFDLYITPKYSLQESGKKTFVPDGESLMSPFESTNIKC